MTFLTRFTSARRYALGAVVSWLAVACSSVSDPVQPLSTPSDVAPSVGINATHPVGVLDSKLTSFVGRPFGIAISSNGAGYVTEQDANAVARFLTSNPVSTLVPIPVTADPGDVIFNRAGTLAFASTYFGGQVHVIDVASGAVNTTIPVGNGTNAYRLALAKDESRLFVTTSYGVLYAITHGVSQSITLSGALQGIALSPSGNALYVTSTSGTIWRIDPTTLAIQWTGNFSGEQFQDVAVTPDGSTVYIADETGRIQVADATNFVPRALLTLPGSSPFGLAISPDGARVYVASPSTGLLTIIAPPRHHGNTYEMSNVYVGGTPRRIAFDATGATAYVSNEGNWVDVVK